MFATHAAEVEVDVETGIVKVLKIAAAHDVGRVINPQLCEQQIEGSVVMGISNTLMEEFKMDKGRVLNNTLADYKLATMMDLPEIVPIMVEAGHPEGPFGAKGAGEPAVAPTAPAIANAIFDAIGVRIKELPITPEKIRAALKNRPRAEKLPSETTSDVLVIKIVTPAKAGVQDILRGVQKFLDTGFRRYDSNKESPCPSPFPSASSVSERRASPSPRVCTKPVSNGSSLPTGIVMTPSVRPWRPSGAGRPGRRSWIRPGTSPPGPITSSP